VGRMDGDKINMNDGTEANTAIDTCALHFAITTYRNWRPRSLSMPTDC
jgi:hypothetical protein